MYKSSQLVVSVYFKTCTSNYLIISFSHSRVKKRNVVKTVKNIFPVQFIKSISIKKAVTATNIKKTKQNHIYISQTQTCFSGQCIPAEVHSGKFLQLQSSPDDVPFKFMTKCDHCGALYTPVFSFIQALYFVTLV